MKADATSHPRTGYRFLDAVERIGNRLPDPVTLFVAGALLVLVGSHLAALAGWKATYTVAGPAGAELREVAAKSLLEGEGLRWVWLNVVRNFTDFHPLGVVLVCMLGIGVAERTGLIAAVLRLVVVLTPARLLVPTVVFAGIMSNVAADAGYVVLPPLAAAIFAKMGRAPLAGLAAVFAGVAAGFSANLLPSALDPLLQGITQESARLLEPTREVGVLCNYWFMAVSTVVLTFVGWFITAKFVEPRFSRSEVQAQIATQSQLDAPAGDAGQQAATAAREARGLLAALAALLACGGVLAALVMIPGWPLHGEYLRAGRMVPIWADVIVPAMLVLFLVPGLAYGIAVGSIRSDRAVAGMMGATMSSMGMYIVLAFVAGQFVAWFRESNLGTLIALASADAIATLSLPPMLLVVAILLLTAFINLFIGSASAKWALLAPVFVPLFMRLGISPELTQAAYRVGDSCTNPVAPLNAYLVVVLVVMQRIAPKAGLGSLIALMLPYAIGFLIAWTLLLLAYVQLGLPLGPGAESFMPVPGDAAQ
jgi:aminobenzoyl-glutamate transport protein